MRDVESIKLSPLPEGARRPPRTKKADVAEHRKVFDHVGLLTNEPPGSAKLLFI